MHVYIYIYAFNQKLTGWCESIYMHRRHARRRCMEELTYCIIPYHTLFHDYVIMCTKLSKQHLQICRVTQIFSYICNLPASRPSNDGDTKAMAVTTDGLMDNIIPDLAELVRQRVGQTALFRGPNRSKYHAALSNLEIQPNPASSTKRVFKESFSRSQG